MATHPDTLIDQAEQDRSSPPLFDSVIVFVAGALMVLGVTMVYSASTSVSGPAFDWRQWWHTPLRQAAFAVAGFVVMLVAAHVDYRRFAWTTPRRGWIVGVLFVLTILLLVAVLIPGVGRSAMGARRSLPMPGLGGLGFQPSELAKVTLVMWVAAWVTRMRGRRGPRRNERFPLVSDSAAPDGLHSFVRGLLPIVATSGVVVALIGVEDFGTAALLGAVVFAMLVVAGARWLHLAAMGLLGLAGAAGLVLIEPYRVGRIKAYIAGLFGEIDVDDAGYQIHQAMLAIGSGGWFGRGLGAGVQKYGYLPQDNNDFILAIICEELGAVGGLVVIGLFLVLLWRGWRLATRLPDEFGRLLALGLTLTICVQAAFNIAVVTHLVPTKGISLPFVSAGGSGVVFLGLATGLLAATAGGLGAHREDAAE